MAPERQVKGMNLGDVTSDEIKSIIGDEICASEEGVRGPREGERGDNTHQIRRKKRGRQHEENGQTRKANEWSRIAHGRAPGRSERGRVPSSVR